MRTCIRVRPQFTDRTNEVYRLNRAIKIKDQMKADSGVLNTFEKVSGGFLNPNKFKLLLIWQPWVVS